MGWLIVPHSWLTTRQQISEQDGLGTYYYHLDYFFSSTLLPAYKYVLLVHVGYHTESFQVLIIYFTNLD